MKKIILTLTTLVLSTLSANASETICGANIETEKGSGIYNKNLFWEKADISKSTTRFLLPDGTVLKTEELKADVLEKIPNDSIIMGYSFQFDQTIIFLAKIKKDSSNVLKNEETIIASGLDGKSVMLIAKGISLSCVATK